MYKYNDLSKTTKSLAVSIALLAAVSSGGCASPAAQQDHNTARPGTATGLAATPPPQTRRISASALRDAVRDDVPLRYVVQPGDTLWDIARHFLVKPWYWPELWHANQDIHNPHRIYPGQVLVLTHVERRPRIKLSPSVREQPVQQPIPTIPADALEALLHAPHLTTIKTLDNAPYIVALEDEHLIAGAGMTAFVRNLQAQDPPRLDILQPGKPLIDPDSGAQIGVLAAAVGQLGITERGDGVATATIMDSRQAVRPADRLLPARSRTEVGDFRLRMPKQPLTGHIMATPNDNTILGQYDIVVINRGSRDGLRRGHLLRIYRTNRTVTDPVSHDSVALPAQRIGVLMLFEINQRASLGIVLESSHAVRPLDQVRAAQS